MAQTTQSAVSGQKAKSGDIDSFLNDLMSPSSGNNTQIRNTEGDISLYQCVPPADIYTAATLMAMLKSPITQAYASKIENMADYQRLLEADLLIEQASPEKKRSIEELISSSSNSASLQLNLTKAAGIFLEGMTQEDKERKLATLLANIREGYIDWNRGNIEQRLKREFNFDSEVHRQVRNKSRITRGAIAAVLAAALALFGYLGIKNYQKQVDIQRDFGTYIEQTYKIELPESFYQDAGGGN